MASFRGVLIDIDGVLHVSMQAIAGANETLRLLESQGYQVCFVTNTTTSSRATLVQKLRNIGMPLEEQHVLTAPVATANYIRQHYRDKRCWLLTKGDTAGDFEGIQLVDTQADIVVIGGAEELLTYENMNKAFRMLMNGAILIAHIVIYIGVQAKVYNWIVVLLCMHWKLLQVKKRSFWESRIPAFFEQALLTIDVRPEEALMVGDDIENDIGGAQGAGLRGALVCTGKHNAQSPLLNAYIPM